jgi:hypothetical protein
LEAFCVKATDFGFADNLGQRANARENQLDVCVLDLLFNYFKRFSIFIFKALPDQVRQSSNIGDQRLIGARLTYVHTDGSARADQNSYFFTSMRNNMFEVKHILIRVVKSVRHGCLLGSKAKFGCEMPRNFSARADGSTLYY